MSPVPALDALTVVVPVHDEQTLLDRCLSAVADSVRHLGAERPDLRVATVVVLDDCRDGSAAVASTHAVRCVEVRARSVGAARAAGAARARLLEHGLDGSRHWLSCTDADSQVPREWLSDQVRAAEAGALLVLGEVEPFGEDLDEEVRGRWASYAALAGPGVHGANLGVRMDAYLAAGGFPAWPEHEDVGLVDALGALGVVAAAGATVLTSGRREGRAPGGFSGLLRRLEEPGPLV